MAKEISAEELKTNSKERAIPEREKMEEEKDERKQLKVISGNGSELKISPAYEHLNDAKPQDTQGKKPKNIVVPKEISKKKQEDNN